MDETKPLYAQLGLRRDDAIIVAYIPATAEVMEEWPYRDGGREFVVYSQNGKVVDMLPYDARSVKWWMVKEAARAARKDFVEPIWSCAAEDFTVQKIPDVPQPTGTKLAIRCYSHGPWLTLTKENDAGADGRAVQDSGLVGDGVGIS